MKKSTLTLTFGAGLATAIMGTISPASALTISGPGGTGTVSTETLGFGSLTGNYNVTTPAPGGATANFFLDTVFTKGTDYNSMTGNYIYVATMTNNNVAIRPWDTFVIEHPGLTINSVTGSFASSQLSTGKITMQFSPDLATGQNVSFVVNFVPNTTPDSFTFKQYATPEPLTILGTGVVLGAIPALKKEYARRVKKKSVNA